MMMDRIISFIFLLNVFAFVSKRFLTSCCVMVEPPCREDPPVNLLLIFAMVARIIPVMSIPIFWKKSGDSEIN